MYYFRKVMNKNCTVVIAQTLRFSYVILVFNMKFSMWIYLEFFTKISITRLKIYCDLWCTRSHICLLHNVYCEKAFYKYKLNNYTNTEKFKVHP